MGQTTGPRVRFGSVEFDVATGDLLRDGQQVRLQEQPRQVLEALLARPGEVVSREELRERLWKTDTFVDFEHGLNTAIKKVRQALGDSADSPQYIETLARRGYRFIAPISPPAEPAIEFATVVAPAAPTTELPRRRRRKVRRSALWISAALVLVLSLVAAGVILRERMNEVVRKPLVVQLAVMPLRVLTPSTSDSAYLGVGIADAIITRLANVRQIALRPTSAVLPYTDAESDPERVASALGVQHLLLGTIQETPQEYRVSVQLVRADGVAVWGRTYDVPRADLLRLQDEVAEQVVSALQVQLTALERARLTVQQTRDPAAYDLYLRGRTLLANYTDVNMREAIKRFEAALAIDPNYAQARAALATGCAWFSVRYAYESDAAAWGKRAEDEARKALAQDSELAEAHLAIASAAGTLYRGFDWKTMMSESAAALRLDPSLDLAHALRMRGLYHIGLFEQAREEGRLAAFVNPTPNTETMRLTVATHLFAGEFTEAADEAAALLERTDAPAVRQYLALARFYLGDAPDAMKMLASTLGKGQPARASDVRGQAALASIEAAAGMREAARARATAVEHGSYMDHHVAYSLGAAWAQLGDSAAGVRWLQQAADTGFPCYPWFARDPLLDPVRRDPAFMQLMDRLEAEHRAALAAWGKPQ